MHTRRGILWKFLVLTACVRGNVTADDGTIEYTCTTAVRAVTAGDSQLSVRAGTYHYRVHLPPGYEATVGAVPCLFVFSAGGKATADQSADFAERNGWVVVSLQEARNGPLDPTIGNYLAAYDDATKRLRIQPGMIFLTGMSGGARAAFVCCELRPGVGGVLLQGAGSWLPAGTKPSHSFRSVNPKMAIYATFGNRDPNRAEAITLLHDLPEGTPYRWDVFTGGHQMAPIRVFEPALGWLARQALSRAPRKFVTGECRRLSTAKGSPWERYQALSLVKTLTTDKQEFDQSLTELAGDPQVREQAKAQLAVDAIERTEGLARWKSTATMDQIRAAASVASEAYRRVADQMPGTSAGQTAADRAEYRSLETGK